MKPVIKWLLYYAAHILANGAAVLIFRQYLNITWVSLMPVIYLVLFVLQMCWPHQFARNRWHYLKERTMAGYSHIEKDQDGNVTAWGRRYVSKDPTSSDDLRLVFLLLPFCLPFVLFFSTVVKILSFFLYLLIIILYLVIHAIRSKGKGNAVESEKEKLERELKEQQQREEMGRWK